jgi:creatinine amidohydrolase
MRLQFSTWPEIEKYLQNKKTILIPIGSTEQHGPTGVIGIDYLTSEAIANAVGEKTNLLVAPPLCYGMALHHMAFPGSAAFKPSTYLQVIVELIESFATHGFQKIVFINGHGGNIPTVQAAFSEVLQKYPKITVELINWWHLKEVTEYEQQHFGDENGFHATIGEVSVTQHCFPEAHLKPRPYIHSKTVDTHAWPLSPIRFRETFPDGRMGSNPGLASAQHGEQIFKLAVSSIAQRTTD